MDNALVCEDGTLKLTDPGIGCHEATGCLQVGDGLALVNGQLVLDEDPWAVIEYDEPQAFEAPWNKFTPIPMQLVGSSPGWSMEGTRLVVPRQGWYKIEIDVRADGDTWWEAGGVITNAKTATTPPGYPQIIRGYREAAKGWMPHIYDVRYFYAKSSGATVGPEYAGWADGPRTRNPRIVTGQMSLRWVGPALPASIDPGN